MNNKPYFQRPTSRQMQVGELWAMGRNSSQIAIELSVGHRTVESHIAGFYQRTGTNNHAEVFDWFLEHIWNGQKDRITHMVSHNYCHSFYGDGRYYTATLKAGTVDELAFVII